MVFSSLSFLFFFFPLVTLSYFLCRKRTARNAVLLLFSLFFYSWGEPRFLAVMIVSSMLGWVSGLLIDRYRDKPGAARWMMILSVSLLLAILFFFKYLNFAVDTAGKIFGIPISVPRVFLPIGISFYTFQILSYVIDLYRGKVSPQRNPLRFLLYASFFPQLIAGPIVRYATIENELVQRQEHLEDICEGLKRFILGLGKKLILANQAAAISELIYTGNPEIYGTAMYWLAALCYSFQIYFDFSGYSDMAIGLGRIFGFHFPENFDHPYLAESLTDFWRRWHISLGTWFRDYVYIPLGGNRVRAGRWMLNVMLVWALTGLWHGAGWNFVFWGMLNGLMLIAEKRFLLRWMERVPGWVRIVFTFLFVTISWVCFNLTDITRLRLALEMMFSLHRTDWLGVLASDAAITAAWLFVPLCFVCCFPWLSRIRPAETPAAEVLRCVLWLALFGVCIMVMISSTYNPFIYFRF